MLSLCCWHWCEAMIWVLSWTTKVCRSIFLLDFTADYHTKMFVSIVCVEEQTLTEPWRTSVCVTFHRQAPTGYYGWRGVPATNVVFLANWRELQVRLELCSARSRVAHFLFGALMNVRRYGRIGAMAYLFCYVCWLNPDPKLYWLWNVTDKY